MLLRIDDIVSGLGKKEKHGGGGGGQGPQVENPDQVNAQYPYITMLLVYLDESSLPMKYVLKKNVTSENLKVLLKKLNLCCFS